MRVDDGQVLKTALICPRLFGGRVHTIAAQDIEDLGRCAHELGELVGMGATIPKRGLGRHDERLQQLVTRSDGLVGKGVLCTHVCCLSVVMGSLMDGDGGKGKSDVARRGSLTSYISLLKRSRACRVADG